MASPISQALMQLRKLPQSLELVAKNACISAGLALDDSAHRSLVESYFSVIAQVQEAGARLQQAGEELAYHNRAHVADAITALGCLFAVCPDISDADKWLAMIAMAGHDYGHQGKTNPQLGYSQEEMTFDWLQQYVGDALTKDQISRLRGWIVATDPALVEANHCAYEASPKDDDALLQIMINEADIAASLVPNLALGLTRQLLLERGVTQADESEVMAVYEGFRAQTRISSPAAKRLLSETVPVNVLPHDATGSRLFHATYSVSAFASVVARAEVMQTLAQLNLHDQSRLDVEIALGEVLQNIVRHADFKQIAVKKFDIQVLKERSGLTIEVTDSAHPLRDLGFLRQHYAASEKGGMGLSLIQKISSKYSINPMDCGNLYRLEFSQSIQTY